MNYQLKYGPRKRFLSLLLEVMGVVFFRPLCFFLPRKKTKAPHFLLIEPFQMGDVIALSAVFEPLRKGYPGCRISVLGKQGPVQIARLLQEVDQVFSAPFPWSAKGAEPASWWGWFKTMISLRKEGFTLGIDVRGDVRSHLSLMLAGCPGILSYRRYVKSDMVNQGWLLQYPVGDTTYTHIFELNRGLLAGLGFSESSLFPIRFPLFSLRRSDMAPMPEPEPVLLHVGSSWEYKMWPAKNWVGLIKELKSNISHPILILAGPGEEAIVESIRKELEPDEMPEVAFPSLEGLIAQLQRSVLLIGSDSGPMCIANCLNIPRISIFGPGLVSTWKPYSQPSIYLHKVEGYDCYPCLLKECVRPDSPCISQIQIQDVYLAAKELLALHPGPTGPVG